MAIDSEKQTDALAALYYAGALTSPLAVERVHLHKGVTATNLKFQQIVDDVCYPKSGSVLSIRSPAVYDVHCPLRRVVF